MVLPENVLLFPLTVYIRIVPHRWDRLTSFVIVGILKVGISVSVWVHFYFLGYFILSFKNDKVNKFSHFNPKNETNKIRRIKMRRDSSNSYLAACSPINKKTKFDY